MDVWIVRTSDVDRPTLQGWFDWLTPAEQRKHARFATEGLQREYLVTRGLSRLALSRYVPNVAPSEWRFERTDAGRPFVVAPSETPQFNLTNASGLVACAVSAHRIGVDVEPSTRGDEILANAARLFSNRENADLLTLAEDQRSQRAVELWTLKEAYLKARGEGIAVHMNRFSLELAASGSPKRFRLAAGGLGDDPAAWQLEVTDLDVGTPEARRYVLAVAIERRGPNVDVFFEDAMKRENETSSVVTTPAAH